MRLFAALLALIFTVKTAYGHDMVSLVKKVKPSVVGIGVYTPLGQPKNELRGTGFVISNGQYVATNHHVLPEVLDTERLQEMVVFVGVGKKAKARKAKIVASSRYHDLAILKVEGDKLPAMPLAGDEFYPEGSEVGFTGFPIGAILGLFPVTHKAMLASITPVVIPVKDTRQMSIAMLKRLRDPYMVYQLDGTAYPGNSGSALYDETGKVIGVINKVFVQSTKEAVISNPSGITYAIPVRHLRKLMRDNQVPDQ
ncbi:S1 family peptidase [Thalassotalea euphylliae]|uniref:Serine protease n=1 Tax=Thalassotalea euphylliae TaxID=1655234 RepID=A0A3E0ULA1_9GAMM|nr:serine protease [Thalassotalea euphylliae]REL37055.1 serine protease [Thalassotalea euphylliae]